MTHWYTYHLTRGSVSTILQLDVRLPEWARISELATWTRRGWFVVPA